jgi:hypothetical protein
MRSCEAGSSSSEVLPLVIADGCSLSQLGRIRVCFTEFMKNDRLLIPVDAVPGQFLLREGLPASR